MTLADWCSTSPPGIYDMLAASANFAILDCFVASFKFSGIMLNQLLTVSVLELFTANICLLRPRV